MNKAIKIIAEFVGKIYLFEKNNRFLNETISLLEEHIKLLIHIELITKYNREEYKEQKIIYMKYIQKKFERNKVEKIL